MFQKLLEEWMDNTASHSEFTVLSESVVSALYDFTAWLDTRSPTLRAPVDQATTEALIEDIMNYIGGSLANDREREFERFLRERLGRR